MSTIGDMVGYVLEAGYDIRIEREEWDFIHLQISKGANGKRHAATLLLCESDFDCVPPRMLFDACEKKMRELHYSIKRKSG